MNLWDQTTAKVFLVPGSILLFLLVLLDYKLAAISASVLVFYYIATFAAGLILAWRFHSTRILFLLTILVLSERTIALSPRLGDQGFAAISILLPLNFLALSFVRERGFTAPAIAARSIPIFLQAVFVALMCRPDHAAEARLLQFALVHRHWPAWIKIPQLGLLAFLLSLSVLVLRFVLYRKPVESGCFWALLLTCRALQLGGTGKPASVYFATAALVLVAAVIETSYLMAYHDELTGLPARRAFNQAVLELGEHYAIAVVDVDHFKRFNDTFGHDIGDEVLRMVASRLAKVTGGGKAYRCGGEEFSVVFPSKSARDAMEHLELLRQSIEGSRFRVRGRLDRRKTPRGPDRRRIAIKRRSRALATRRAFQRPGGNVSVTVSIGVAEPSTKNHLVDQVIKAADQALYRAKERGRNRVVMDTPEQARSAAHA
ncbi:MAG TPA: GGDEF domain-containing protein [Terriglobales bacterium]|nr:GGDEF domain-containing protein [Terriglobales bacterium]